MLKPSSTTLVIKPENGQCQTFDKFFDGWLGELNNNLEQLVSAANDHHEDESRLRRLIVKVVRHYEKYYKVKADGAKVDVLSMFTPAWLSTLEYAFMWIAGWRPTTAIHLLYSKSGIQLESRLNDLSPFSIADDLGDLSFNQMNRIDVLQRKTIREERVISEKMATLQESAADTVMVNLSNAISEMIREKKGNEEMENDERMDSEMGAKKDGLEEVLHLADGLRMETLKAVVEILTPIQAVYFLIALAELHLRLHDWGKKRDEF